MKRGVKQVGESCYDCLSLNGCGKSNADSGTVRSSLFCLHLVPGFQIFSTTNAPDEYREVTTIDVGCIGRMFRSGLLDRRYLHARLESTTNLCLDERLYTPDFAKITCIPTLR